MTDLGTVRADSCAEDINELGRVVKYEWTSCASRCWCLRAFLWDSSMITYLEPLGSEHSMAYNID